MPLREENLLVHTATHVYPGVRKGWGIKETIEKICAITCTDSMSNSEGNFERMSSDSSSTISCEDFPPVVVYKRTKLDR